MENPTLCPCENEAKSGTCGVNGLGISEMLVKAPVRILLITPPMTQINTPYPATAYLTGFLRDKGFEVDQRDLSL